MNARSFALVLVRCIGLFFSHWVRKEPSASCLRRHFEVGRGPFCQPRCWTTLTTSMRRISGVRRFICWPVLFCLARAMAWRAPSVAMLSRELSPEAPRGGTCDAHRLRF